MQGRVAFAILVIKDGDPAEQVDKGDFRLRVARPVKCCRPAVVSAPKIQASKLEEVKGNRLISLGGYVQHIDSEIVDGINVSPIGEQKLAQLRIPFEAGEMERSESVDLGFVVDPVAELLCCQSFLGVLDQRFDDLLVVVEACLVEEGVTTGVNDLVYFNVGIDLQGIDQSVFAAVLADLVESHFD